MREDSRIELDGDYSIEVVPAKKSQAYYIFREGNIIVQEILGQQPKALGEQSQVAKKIKEYLDLEGKYKTEIVNNQFQDIRMILQELYETIILVEEQLEREAQQKSESELRQNINDASELLQNLPQPLLWIGSVTEWLTAGERLNIMLAFLAYACQIILKHPISVIALGDAGSGKSHVVEVALSFIPDEFITFEKNITEPALFRRAEDNPRFYDGKIVVYGDMGGDHDHEDMEKSKNLMKELQTDGFLNKPISTPDPELGWIVKDLTLEGTPALTYTTVPNYNFDEQELSRSIFVTPRMDNKEIFNKRSTLLEFKGKTYLKMEKYEKFSQNIQYFLYDLRGKFSENIEIINPYVNLIIDFLRESKYYKRDFPKYNWLLKTITALNYYQREVLETESGRKIMFVTLDDVKLFMTLLKPYQISINANLSPKASEILSDLHKNLPKWLNNNGVFELGITVNDYVEKTNINLNKRSVRRYFTELNENGFIKVVETKGRTNVWDVTEKVSPELFEDNYSLNQEVQSIIASEWGEEIIQKIQKDVLTPNLDIMNIDKDIEKPLW